MKNYVVIGAGIAGLTAASALSDLGHSVDVIEKNGSFGGKVLSYCCKATDSCSRCGVCVAHTKIAEAAAKKTLSIHKGSTIKSVSNTGTKVSLKINRKNPFIDHKMCIACGKCVEVCPEGCISVYHRGELIQYVVDYSRCRLHNGGKCSECISVCPVDAVDGGAAFKELTLTGAGILVAAGHQPFDAVEKPRYGYRRSTNVLTGTELEDILSRDLSLPEPSKRIAFIQCVGSRDPVISRNYCSSVCCAYALRLARVLKHRDSSLDVTVYYIDLQNFDKTFTLFKEELVEMGVNLHRGLPFRVDECLGGSLKVMLESGEGKESFAFYDKVVLSVGLGPEPGAEHLAEQCGLERDLFGFYTSTKDNVFVSGTCREPQSIPESIADAEAAAINMELSV